MYAITAMAMRKFLAKERMEAKRRAEREKAALLALELCRIETWLEDQQAPRVELPKRK